MGTWLGRRWKHWAVQAYEGDGLAVVRINGIRYERKLVRVFYSPLLEGVIDKKIAKYRSRITREAIESGETWVFELAPREGAPMQRGAAVAKRCYEKGAWVRPIGDSLVLSPPLIISEAEIKRIFEIIGEAICEVG